MIKNQVYIPTVAKFAGDIQTSLDLQSPLVENGFRKGLMVVIQKGIEGVTDPEIVKKQYDNLANISSQYGDSNIVVMLSNIPLEQIDTLNNQEFALQHVQRGIDFAKNLPIGKRKTLTFHLNSLVPENEFREKTRKEWYKQFDDVVRPGLEQISRYGNKNGIEVLVETVPVKEFGDDSPDNPSGYRGFQRRELMNPFYIFKGNHIENVLNFIGLGLCVDLCHTRTIYRQAYNGNQGIVLFDEDADEIVTSGKNLLGEVKSPNTRLIHLNDGSGDYTRQGGMFLEGMTLGKGDINLPPIIDYILQNQTPFVLEINEIDFKERPNTKDSIAYLLKQR